MPQILYTLEGLKKHIISIAKFKNSVTGEEEFYAGPSNCVQIPKEVLESYAVLLEENIDRHIGYIAKENIWFVMSKNYDEVVWSHRSSLKIHRTDVEIPTKRRFTRYTALLDDKE